jgi:single-strand DNA-binding protein
MYNSVTLAGNLGKDPETKTFDNGGSITNATMATSESWKDKQTGEKKERTTWHNLVFQNRLGEIVQQYCSKGSSLLVSGSIRVRDYDKNGVKTYITEIMVRDMKMLGSKGDNAGSAPSQNQASQNFQKPADDDFNDSIPF